MLNNIARSFLFLLIISCTSKQQTVSRLQISGVNKINGMEFLPLSLPNQLEVLVVSDPRFKQSSAAMSVGVGSLADPKEAQGLAHYLEHMLFLGTKEFPKPDEYSKFMETHGGVDNAYTAEDATNYFFEIDNSAFKEALHRFSRFFVSPLFTEELLTREKNAVNSEFDKNIKNDGWRMMRFLNTLSSPGHPMGQFTIGNTQTLAPVTRAQVVDFYHRYYSANTMKLVVMGTEPIEQLKKWVEVYFSDIPNHRLERPKYKDEFLDIKNPQKLHFIKTIKDTEVLQITYNVPDEDKYFESKPLQIIGKIVGHEGRGSLLSYLQQRGWALGLVAGGGQWRTFQINIMLTPLGRKHYNDVIKSVFDFIEFVRITGYPEYLYEDEKSIRKIELENLEPESSANRAAGIAKVLLDLPVDHFLEDHFLISKYSPEDFNRFLSYLRPENAIIIIGSQNEKTNQKEDIFGVEYLSQTLPPRDSSQKIQEKFYYPEKNKYIPNDFSLISKNIQGPPLQKKMEGEEISTQEDTELGLAKGFLLIQFMSEQQINPKNHLLNVLFARCKEEELKEWKSPLTEARYQYDLDGSSESFSISLSGYSQHLRQVALDIVKTDKQELKVCKLSTSRFEEIKQQFKKETENTEVIGAIQRLVAENQIVLDTKAIHWHDYQKLIPKVTLQQVNEHADHFFKKYYLFVSGYGNIRAASVEDLAQEIFKIQKAEKLPEEKTLALRRRYRRAPAHAIYSMRVRGKNNNNAILQNYQISPWSVENHALTIILGQLLAQPYFAELRTQQQLGYVVNAAADVLNGSASLRFIIQSQKYSPQLLAAKSNEFVKNYFSQLQDQLKESDFNAIRSSLVNELKIKPNTMNQRFMQFYSQASQFYGRFKINDELVHQIENTNLSTFKNFIKKSFIEQSPAVVTYYYFGEKAPQENQALPGRVFERVSDIKDWIVENPYKNK